LTTYNTAPRLSLHRQLCRFLCDRLVSAHGAAVGRGAPVSHPRAAAAAQPHHLLRCLRAGWY